MIRLIKQIWCKRILEQKQLPAVERKRAEFILNSLYVELTGNEIMFPNTHKCVVDGQIPEYVTFGYNDRIAQVVKEWAGLPFQEPKLPSYTSIGGVHLTPAYQTLSAIQDIGIIKIISERREGIGKVITKELSRKINLTEIAKLIELDC